MLNDRYNAEMSGKALTAGFFLAMTSICAVITVKLGANISSSTVAGVLIFVFTMVAFTSPKAIIPVVFIYLAVLGDVRRWFAVNGATSTFDFLLLVGPLTAIAIGVKLLYTGQIRSDTTLTRWMMVLALFMFIEIFNVWYLPLTVNVAGAMFYVIPIIWFWIGVRYGDREFSNTILFRLVFLIGIATCVLGLWQSFIGFLDFENDWIRNTAETSLTSINVGARARPFAFFVSPAEYAHYALVGTVITFCGFFSKHWRKLLLFLPLFILTLMTTGSRGIIVSLLATGALLWMFLARGSLTSVGRLIMFSIVALAGLYFGLTWATSADLGENINPLVERQASGLLNPLDPSKSTAGDHGTLFLYGILSSVTAPAGKGLGWTTIAGSKFGADGGGTEVDISNMFASLSPFGGIVYVCIVFIILKKAVKHLRRTRTVEAFAITAILLAEFGQWLNGGHYAVSALVWFCIGALENQDQSEIVLTSERKVYLLVNRRRQSAIATIAEPAVSS